MLTAEEYYGKMYGKVCYNWTDFMKFAEAYANYKLSAFDLETEPDLTSME